MLSLVNVLLSFVHTLHILADSNLKSQSLTGYKIRSGDGEEDARFYLPTTNINTIPTHRNIHIHGIIVDLHVTWHFEYVCEN